MKKVRVLAINEFEYTLECEGKIYHKNLNFYDTNLNIDDYIYMPDNILKEKNFFTFGPIKEETKEEDVIKIVRGNKQLYLKRYYG